MLEGDIGGLVTVMVAIAAALSCGYVAGRQVVRHVQKDVVVNLEDLSAQLRHEVDEIGKRADKADRLAKDRDG